MTIKLVRPVFSIIFILSIVNFSFSQEAAVQLSGPSEASVGQVVTLDVILSNSTDIAAFMFEFQVTSSDGALVEAPGFTTTDQWTSNSSVADPITMLTSISDSGIIVESSLALGDEISSGNVEGFSSPTGTVVGQLSFVPQAEGTVQIEFADAALFIDGLLEPEGANFGIIQGLNEVHTLQITPGAPILLGDINRDNIRDVQDVNLLLDLIVDSLFGNEIDPDTFAIADVAPRDNVDGILDVQDVNVLLDFIVEDLLGL